MMKEKQEILASKNELTPAAIYQARLKRFELFKQKNQMPWKSGFRKIKPETYLVKDYLILNQ